LSEGYYWVEISLIISEAETLLNFINIQKKLNFSRKNQYIVVGKLDILISVD